MLTAAQRELALKRLADRNTMTVAQSAERGDTLRVKCLDCNRVREITARSLLARHGAKILNALKPRCETCARSGRRGVGLHKPGYGTMLTVIAPGDPV